MYLQLSFNVIAGLIIPVAHIYFLIHQSLQLTLTLIKWIHNYNHRLFTKFDNWSRKDALKFWADETIVSLIGINYI